MCKASILYSAKLLNTVLLYSLIISIPVDLSGQDDLFKMEEKGVRGRYVSVERLLELENGNTEWRMATSGSSGGLLPGFLTDSMMPSSIAKVSYFFSPSESTKLQSIIRTYRTSLTGSVIYRSRISMSVYKFFIFPEPENVFQATLFPCTSV